jgi:uncharacterized protein YbaR (Trm112 family)
VSRSLPEIACPSCREGRLDPKTEAQGKVRCDRCNAAFDVHGRVIDLLPGFDDQPSPGQKLMEWEPLIEIYESRWWRKSGLFAAMAGIHFDEEYEIIVEALDGLHGRPGSRCRRPCSSA